MSRLMRAFDVAVKDGCGFGHHSIALVACVGLARCLACVRDMYLKDTPQLRDNRKWALSQYDAIDELTEHIDVERCVKLLVDSCGKDGSVAKDMASAFVDHLANNEWIILSEKYDPRLVPEKKP